MKRRLGTMSAGLALAVVASTSCAPPPPNRLVLVTLDTLRYDALLGPGAAEAMPQVSEMLTEALVLDQYFSVSASTQPSHATMLTGLQPWENGLTGNAMRLSEELTTIPERLVAAGWSTAAVVASVPVSSKLGFAQGFEQFDEELDLGRAGGEWRTTDEPTPLYRLAPGVVRAAERILAEWPRKNQFLWLHFFDPHAPYGDTVDPESTLSPPDVLRLAARGEPGIESALEQARTLYDADLRSLDAALAPLLRSLRDDLDFSTSIVLVSDHGESFGEGSSMGHGRRLIPSQIHVPLAIWSPSVTAGRRSDPVGTIDVAVTLAALAGIELEGSAGRDVRLPAPTTRAQPRVFGARRTYSRPYRDRRLDGSIVTISPEPLYYALVDAQLVRGDPHALVPGDGDGLRPEVSTWIVNQFRRFERLRAAAPGSGIAEEELRQLEALGYAR